MPESHVPLAAAHDGSLDVDGPALPDMVFRDGPFG